MPLSRGGTSQTLGGADRKVPNTVLRRIREKERHETRSEFAEALVQKAREIGESVHPTERYIARLEDGDILYPHPAYRRALMALCGRSMPELGFSRDQATVATSKATSTQAQSTYEPTLLRVLVTERHWQKFPTFERQFRRAAAKLADEQDEPELKKATVSPRQFERWYSGKVKTEPYPDACRILESMFGQPVKELLAPPRRQFSGLLVHLDEIDEERSAETGQPGDAVWVRQDGDKEVIRRAFLLNLALITQISKNDPLAALEAVRREWGYPSPAVRHEADLCEWNEITVEYGATYPITAPSDLIRSLFIDFVALQEAFQRYPRQTDQRELYRITALLAGFVAQTLNNLGHVSESRRWWRTARNAADRANDSYSPLWVRGREIVHALGERPTNTVLKLIDEAERFTVGSQPELVMEYLGGKAQTLAIADRGDEAERALNQLRDRFGSSSCTGYSGSLLGWGEERLRNTESFTYSRLGDYDSVDSALLAASRLYKYDSSNLRWPAGAELNRAFCLVRTGDIGAGLSHARAVVASLPATHQTQDIHLAARNVLSAVSWPEVNTPELKAYRDWLDSTFLALPSRPGT